VNKLSEVILIRPKNFGFNHQTASSNSFQNDSEFSENHRSLAIAEFDSMVNEMLNVGLNVHVIEDTAHPIKPDAIFPNNWISTHPDGTVVLYPMSAENRRLERRLDLISTLKKNFIVERVIDLSSFEIENVFLEGTGSIVFDHTNHLAYACRSSRTDVDALRILCHKIGYHPIVFDAITSDRMPIYHTNVMMSVGKYFVAICLESIPNVQERNHVLETICRSSKEVIDLSYSQLNSFAGNMLELLFANGKSILLVSKTAYDSFTFDQMNRLSIHARILPISIPTIEYFGGGSVRCMVLENFLIRR